MARSGLFSIAGGSLVAAVGVNVLCCAIAGATPIHDLAPIQGPAPKSMCMQQPLSAELSSVCYGAEIWDSDPFPVTSRKTKLALRVMSDAVMNGYLSISDVDISSPTKGYLTVQRRDYTLETPWRLLHVGRKYLLTLTPSEISDIASTVQKTNFWALPQSIESDCEDGTPVVIEAIANGRHNIVSQNVACEGSASGIKPLDSVVWKIVFSRICHNNYDECEV